jgi:altronate hydrolase
MEKLCIGLKCGGSDAFSGITANPLLGLFADRFVSEGGTVVLTEVPEMFGAETLLLNRCQNKVIHTKCVHMLDDFRQYFLRYHQPVYENPSPGNKEGGISTLEEKSLGCVQKGGTIRIADVLNYGSCELKNGTNLLSGPGNDLVSSTALAAAGCQLILFTTGRGTPFGTIVPTVKVSSNSNLAKDKPHWIDFDAGRLLTVDEPNVLADELFDFVLDVASEKQTAKNEQNGYRDIAIFRNGVTL